MTKAVLADCLTPEQAELISLIKDVARDTYHLSVDENDKGVNFGLVTDFYMFWIRVRGCNVCFTARQRFKKELKNNRTRILLSKENEVPIFDAIRTIYESFLAYEKTPKNPAPATQETATQGGEPPYKRNALEKALNELDVSLPMLASYVKEHGDSIITARHVGQSALRFLSEVAVVSDADLARFDSPTLYRLLQGSLWRSLIARSIADYVAKRINGDPFEEPFSADEGKKPEEDAACAEGEAEIAPPPVLPAPSIEDPPALKRFKLLRERVIGELTFLSPAAITRNEHLNEIEQVALATDALFEKMLTHLFSIAKPSKDRGIFEEHLRTGCTYAVIAAKLSLSRERIRQRFNKEERRLRRFFKIKMKSDEAILGYLTELCDLFDSLESMGVGAALVMAVKPDNPCLRTFFTNLLFDYVPPKSFSFYKPYAAEKTNQSIAQAFWDRYAARITYPAPSKQIDLAAIPTQKQAEGSPAFVQTFFNRLNRLQPYVPFKKHPQLIYHATPSRYYLPDFIIKTPEGYGVLVVIASTRTIATSSNTARFNALHLFCRENGFGYLILSSRDESIYEIKNMELDKELCALLNERLDMQGYLDWSDLFPLTEHFKINDTVIAAFVLQNHLDYFYKPLRIKRKEE